MTLVLNNSNKHGSYNNRSDNNDDDKNSNRMALTATMAITMTMITFHCYSDHIAIRMTKIRIAMQWHLYAWHTNRKSSGAVALVETSLHDTHTSQEQWHVYAWHAYAWHA